MSAYQPAVELPERVAILARAAAALQLWRARLPAGRPRLFYEASIRLKGDRVLLPV